MQESQSPNAVGITPNDLIQIIGELYAENWARRRAANGNQSLPSEQSGNGRQSASTSDSSMLDGKMSEEVSRQIRPR
jgi:hypothetical protein